MSTVTRPLDVAEVRALLVRAVAEKGADYVYVNPDGERASRDEPVPCCNFDPITKEPSCIAGHVYHYIGILHCVENYTTVGAVQTNYQPFVVAAARGLFAAQTTQDGGGTWGAALAAFDAAVAS